MIETGPALDAMRASMRSFYRLLGERSPGGSVIERTGVLAAVVPSCPQRSIVNAVVYDDADALATTRDELEAAYRAADVYAWTVWVPEDDASAAELLANAGHVLDARPRAMVLDLAVADFDGGASNVDWELTTDVEAIATINEAAYGLPPGQFADAMTAFAESGAWLYLARIDREPVSCVVGIDAGTDCGIYMVATVRHAQRRGLSTALMRQALSDAQARGCTTSSLQGTKFGHPVYRRLGYRDLGAIDMWELRAPDR
jgi:GNAT superfamily N-acetyltransferase